MVFVEWLMMWRQFWIAPVVLPLSFVVRQIEKWLARESRVLVGEAAHKRRVDTLVADVRRQIQKYVA
jgi:hypothetical protein